MADTEMDQLLPSTPASHSDDRPVHGHTITLEYVGLKQGAFDKKYGRTHKEKLSAQSAVRGICSGCQCSKPCLFSALQDKVPVIDLVRTYRFKEYILGDLIAGVSTAVMQVPQSMGYALLASLPPIIGLYTSFFPVLVYFIFGRSRHVSMGTMALSSLVIASAIGKGLPEFMTSMESETSTNNTTANSSENATLYMGNMNELSEVDNEKVRIAMTVSLIAGISLLAMSVFRLGILASYMSEPFIAGYICAANIQVITHQIKHLLGIKVHMHSGPLSFFYLLGDIFLNVKNTNIATLITSVISLSILILVKKLINERYSRKLKVPIPIDIIVVIIATIISHYCTFEERFEVIIIKEIPQGLPEPSVPSVSHFGLFMMDGVTLGIINFVLMFMMVKMFSEKYNYPQDANQEMFASGLCAIFGSFFSSLAPSTSPPRCILSDQTGGRTQLTQLISAVFVLLMLLFLAPLLEPLPVCVLASLILASCIPLFRYYKAVVEYWHTSKFDFVVWMFTAVSTMMIGVDIGILTGIGMTLLTVVVRTQHPHSTKVQMSSQDNFLLDTKKYNNQSLCSHSGIDIIRFESAIYFATLDIFKHRLFTLTAKPADLIQARKQREKHAKVIDENHEEEMKNNLKDDQQTNHNSDNMKAADLRPSECDELTGPGEESTGPGEESTGSRMQAVILDCSTVSFVDTEGAKLLSLLHKDYNSAGVRFVLCNLTETCRDTLSNVKQCKSLLDSAVYPSAYDAILDIRYSVSTKVCGLSHDLV